VPPSSCRPNTLTRIWVAKRRSSPSHGAGILFNAIIEAGFYFYSVGLIICRYPYRYSQIKKSENPILYFNVDTIQVPRCIKIHDCL